MLCVCLPAQAQDADVLAKVTDLNTKAVNAYENLEMDEAAKLLRQALELCAAEGLNDHKAKARTHIHLGMILIGGLKERDRGIVQFKRALEIDPTIKLTKRITNPEIQAAFDEVARGAAAEQPTAEKPVEEKPVQEVARREEPKQPRRVQGIFHQPITEARLGSQVVVKAAVENGLRAERVVLAYRPDGAAEFAARDMEKEGSWYVASIPEIATEGSIVAYYIEARNKGGAPLAANGSANEPHVISLAKSSRVAGGAEAEVEASAEEGEEEEEEDEEDKPTLFVALALGTGVGYASGSPEVNPVNNAGKPLKYSGPAPARLVHLAPEIGYYSSASFILSVQGRLQLVTGANEVLHDTCPANSDGLKRCDPARGAVAFLGKATWLLGSGGAFRTLASVAAGVGAIRHLVDLGNQLDDCGPKKDQPCQDTIVSGMVLLGPGFGFTYELTPAIALLGNVQALIGFPKPTVNLDVNLGVSFGM